MAYEIKRNDRRPYWRVQLKANGQPADLTGASAVRFTMKEGAVVKINKAPMDVVDEAVGIVEYRWVEGDTSASGVYTAEVEVDWGGDPPELQSFPSIGYFAIKINDDLA